VSAIPLLFEDPDVIAVAKPAGLAVIPARGVDPGACLQHQLATVRGERLFVVHRIDRDTSGVVLFARNANAHRALCLAFEQRRVEKAYRAFVAGRLPAP
jgi:23S rRNA-/tRNA-specific pseudouridylate synthase